MGAMLRAVLACGTWLALATAVMAQTPEPPPEVTELRRLLATPAVQAWLAEAPDAGSTAEERWSPKSGHGATLDPRVKKDGPSGRETETVQRRVQGEGGAGGDPRGTPTARQPRSTSASPS
jgi:hypothetical protein